MTSGSVTSRRPAAPPPRKRPRKVVSANPKLKARARAQRRAQWRRQLRRLMWAVVVAAPIGALVWLLVGSSAFAAESVTVSGTHRLTAAEVRAASGIELGTPLAKVDLGEVTARVRGLAPVASVQVDRDWPHGIIIDVVERRPLVAVAEGKRFQLLDATGTAFASVPAVPRGVYVLDAATPEATKAALTVLQALPSGLRAQLASLRASSPEQVTLLLRGGRQALWGGASDNKTKAQALLVLLKMGGTVFDVSAPGVVTRR